MKFAEPIWLLAGLLACAVLVWTWRRYDRRQREALGVFAASHLHPLLTASFSKVRRNWKRGLFLAGIALLFVSLARPQAGFRWGEAKRRGIEILFAVDTSKSMLTPDVKPDRLTRAKMAVDDFVSKLDGDGVGLVAFAGTAFLQCPVTLDYDAFNESLASLDTNTIPRGGTDISSAIREAQAALQNRPATDKILILLTDGEDLQENAVATARAAAQTGLKIFTVGVGSASGDLIPLPAEDGGGFVKDASGQYVKSHLDEKTLQAIAQATGGMYAPLGAQGQGLDTIYQQALAPLHKHNLASRRERIYIERFQWCLAPGLLLLLASLLMGNRRNVPRKRAPEPVPVPMLTPRRRRQTVQRVALLVGATMLLSFQAQASVRDAQSAYQKGDYATALKEFQADAQTHPRNNTLQFDAGTAAYRAAQYARAADDFQKSLSAKESPDPKQLAAQEDAYYDLGNTLYRTGQKTEKSNVQQTIQTWEQAVKSYDGALQLRKGDADSKFNRDFVQKKLDELKKQQKQQQQKQDQQQKNPSQNQQNLKQDQGGGSQAQNQQNKSGKDSAAKNQPNNSGQGSKDQNQTAGNQNGQNQSKSSGGQQPQQQSQANSGSQPKPGNSGKQQNQNATAQNSAGQKQGSQPQNQGEQASNQRNQPAQNQPASDQQGSQGRSLAQKNGGNADQASQVAEQPVPGQMSKEEARQLLDSLRGELRQMPGAQVARGTTAPESDQPIKDW